MKRPTSVIIALGSARHAHRLRLQRRHECTGDDLNNAFGPTNSSATQATDPQLPPTIDPTDYTAEITNPYLLLSPGTTHVYEAAGRPAEIQRDRERPRRPRARPAHQIAAPPNPGRSPQPPNGGSDE